MSSKSTVLAGVAAAAILWGTGGMAFAQSGGYDTRYGNGPAQSTPAEMQETNQLNQQGVNGTTQPPAVLNGEGQEGPSPYAYQAQYSGPPPQNAPMGEEGGAPYGGPQGYGNQYPPEQANGPMSGSYGQQSQSNAQYDAQEQQYQDQMQDYQNQQRHYQNERQRYNANVRAYDLAQYAWSYPQPYAYHYGNSYGLQPLYLMAEPSQQLSQAPVEGPGGRWVGRVRNVQTAPDGRPGRIEIALNRRVSVWVQPGDLRFDPDQHILYTDLTRDQLWTLPGATIESAPF